LSDLSPSTFLAWVALTGVLKTPASIAIQVTEVHNPPQRNGDSNRGRVIYICMLYILYNRLGDRINCILFCFLLCYVCVCTRTLVVVVLCVPTRVVVVLCVCVRTRVVVLCVCVRTRVVVLCVRTRVVVVVLCVRT